jgi:hypothetical protein
VAKIQRIFDGVVFNSIHFLAPIAAASFCGAQRNKRYSGKREIATKKEWKPEGGEWELF